MKQIASGILLILCIASVQAAFSKMEWRNDFILRSGCLEEENLTLDEVEAAMERGEMRYGQRNSEMRCFLACLLEHSGYISNCQVNEKKFADNERMQAAHNRLMMCKDQVDAEDRCDCAMQLGECMIKMILD